MTATDYAELLKRLYEGDYLGDRIDAAAAIRDLQARLRESQNVSCGRRDFLELAMRCLDDDAKAVMNRAMSDGRIGMRISFTQNPQGKEAVEVIKMALDSIDRVKASQKDEPPMSGRKKASLGDAT